MQETKAKKISEMSKKELQDEINHIEQFIEHCATGTSDLFYRSNLYKEVEKRGYEITSNNKISLK